ncbi:unnamed protein product [Calicophoron daubneyi]|uniref:Cystatin domain-containing protein n=1 Tax=Calicophoron daubneyi TaxID=300641 RepID=A0AAV2TL89_CALDB
MYIVPTCGILVLACVMVSGQMLYGGFTRERPLTDDEELEFRDLITRKLPAIVGTDVEGFRFISVQTQVVAGINYRVLIQMPDGSCASVIIFKYLPTQGGKTSIVDVGPVPCPNK